MELFNSRWFLTRSFVPLLLVISVLATTNYSNQQEYLTDNSINKNITKKIDNFFENNLKLAYGSMLNTSCSYNYECFLKNSACNPLTKRCECMPNLLNDDKLCPVSICSSMKECYDNFENSACILGRCQCIYGLKPDGSCASPTPGVPTNQLPEWGIYLIAISAMFGGIFGGRSKAISAIVRNLVEVFVLVAGLLSRTNMSANVNLSANVNNGDQQDDEVCETKHSGHRAHNNGHYSGGGGGQEGSNFCPAGDSTNTEIALPIANPSIQSHDSKSRPSSPSAQLTIFASFCAQQQQQQQQQQQ